MSGHLGAEIAAFVDGELDDASREQVLRHLADCGPCRAEVEEQRRFKTRLLGLSGSTPAPDLAARLLELAGADPAGPGPRGPLRPPTAPRARRGSHGPRTGRVPKSAVGGAVVALGLGAVLALGGQHRAPTRAAVDPTSEVLLTDFASTSGELPLPEPAGVSVPSPAR